LRILDDLLGQGVPLDGAQVPNEERGVLATGDQAGAVARQGQGGDLGLVAWERGQPLTGGQVPQPDLGAVALGEGAAVGPEGVGVSRPVARSSWPGTLEIPRGPGRPPWGFAAAGAPGSGVTTLRPSGDTARERLAPPTMPFTMMNPPGLPWLTGVASAISRTS